MELKRRSRVVAAVVREDVEELAHEVEGFARHVRDLEDGADALADELGLRARFVFQCEFVT